MERVASTTGCLIRIRSAYPSMAKVHRRIADRILSIPRGIVTMPVTELAELAGASEASVVLFCKKLGYRGFQHLKFVLSEEVFAASSSDIHEEIDRRDEVPVIIKKVFNTSIQALRDTMRILDQSALQTAAEAILAANRVLIVGVGISGMIAEDFWMKLFRINRNVAFYNDHTWMRMAAAIAGPGDLVFAISHSGSTKPVIDALTVAKGRGARTIGLTNYMNSPRVEDRRRPPAHLLAGIGGAGGGDDLADRPARGGRFAVRDRGEPLVRDVGRRPPDTREAVADDKI